MKYFDLKALLNLVFNPFAWVMAAGLAGAQTGGAIDTTFGSSGIAQNTTVTGSVTQVTGLSDGKVLAAGGCVTGFGSGACLYRWTSSGAADASFGINGVAYMLQNGSEPKFAVRPDGRIAVAATCGGTICIAQSNASGTAFDPTFAGGSFTTLNPPNVNGFNSVSLRDLALLPDGRLLVGGQCLTAGGTSGFCVASVLPNAQLDAAFGTSPHNWATTLPGSGDDLQKLTLLPDGRFVASGVCGDSQATRFSCIGRFLSTGGFQQTYTFDVSNRWERITDARVVGNYITVAGLLYDFVGPTWNNIFPFAGRREIYAVPSGLDTSFGGTFPTVGIAGGFNIDSSNDGSPESVGIIAPDGGILYAGRCNSGTVLCLMRLASNGTLDSAFGVAGRYEYSGYAFPNATVGGGNAMGLGPRNQFYLAGSCTGSRPCVYRFNDVIAAGPRCSLDIDGDGRINATTDGLILLRAMLGFTGTSAMANTASAGATRTTWSQVSDYLFDQCRMPVSAQ